MQTIVNLVWGGLGVAWVPASVMQFRRAGVVYRSADEFALPVRRGARRPSTTSGPRATQGKKAEPVLPSCETSLVWPPELERPALQRFVAFVQSVQLS